MVFIIAKPDEVDYTLNAEKINHRFEAPISGVCRSLGMNGRIISIIYAPDSESAGKFLDDLYAGMAPVCPGIRLAASAIHNDYT